MWRAKGVSDLSIRQVSNRSLTRFLTFKLYNIYMLICEATSACNIIILYIEWCVAWCTATSLDDLSAQLLIASSDPQLNPTQSPLNCQSDHLWDHNTQCLEKEPMLSRPPIKKWPIEVRLTYVILKRAVYK